MSIFGSILGRIFNHGGKKADAPAGQATPAPAQPAVQPEAKKPVKKLSLEITEVEEVLERKISP